jgi:hypothetical protein
MAVTKSIARAVRPELKGISRAATRALAWLSLACASACLPSDFRKLHASREDTKVDACMAERDGDVSSQACAVSPRDAAMCEDCRDAQAPDAQVCSTCRDAGTEPPPADAASEPSCPADAECQPAQTSACLNGDSCGHRVCTEACTWGPCEPKMPDGCLRIGPGHEDEGSNYRCCGEVGHWQFCLPTCTWPVQCVACSEGAPSFCDCH